MCFLSGLRLLVLAGVSQWQIEDTRHQWSISRKASYTGAMMEWWVERVITYYSQPFQKQRKTQDVRSFLKTYFLNKSFISNNLLFYLQNNVFSLWHRHLEIHIDTKTTTKKYVAGCSRCVKERAVSILNHYKEIHIATLKVRLLIERLSKQIVFVWSMLI